MHGGAWAKLAGPQNGARPRENGVAAGLPGFGPVREKRKGGCGLGQERGKGRSGWFALGLGFLF